MNTDIQAIIEGNAPMSLEQIIKQEVDDWVTSEVYRWMLAGQRYYLGKTDILNRKRLIIGPGGEMIEDTNLSNNKLVHNFTRKLVDQKVGYLLSKEMSIQTKNKKYQEALATLFDQGMNRTIKNLGKETINKGIAWLHVYYNEEGVLSFKRMRSDEIIPIWQDEDHTQLQAVIRRYTVETYESTNKKEVVKVEWWDTNGVKRYTYDGGVVPDDDSIGNHFVMEWKGEEKPLNWERVPFIPFKANDEEQPLIELIKSLVDDYDLKSSDNSNNLQDLPNSIYVLKDYDGTDLGQFRYNLAAYRAVKVTGEGGVDTLDLTIDTEAFKTHQNMTRKNIYEFGRGVDIGTENFNGATGVALKQLYNDLDMDANILETEFQASFEQLLWFIETHLANTGIGNFADEDVEFIFNRDILVNETDAITNAKNSVGIISDETITANHPWTKDIQAELDRIKKEKESVMDDYPSLVPVDQTSIPKVADEE
ncbi:portal protein [Paenibacillus macquariensis subsp. defensor]|nr:portal protein [Paenibacillus macquariensis subsp. defensor]